MCEFVHVHTSELHNEKKIISRPMNMSGRRQSVLQPLENTGQARRTTLGGAKRTSISNGRRASTMSRPAPQQQPRRQSMMPASTKPPTTPGRKSTQPNRSRLSGWNGRYGLVPVKSYVDRGVTTQIVQDNRPLKNKQYQTEMIIGLLEYLESHGFTTKDGHSSTFTVEEMRMPSTTTIHQIFEFLIRQIDESFSLDRMEHVCTCYAVCDF